ncbi:MAG TPA: phenylalanine 4-monooxygenase [Acidimicrobiales bacterium]|nr:phenylalanine 4-monooxygenase [Acidimicrobiales bacterium]
MATPASGSVYELPADHPGFHDADYRRRRADIAAVGEAYRPGDALPLVTYTAEEDEVWRLVSSELAVKHRRAACRQYLEGAEALVLPAERVPQLAEVDEHLRALTGFGIRPVPGLVPSRVFYASLAERRFMSTQYVRHHSVPFYTPEPDIIHEIIGHANALGHPAFADLYELAGQASLRADTAAAHDFFSRVFWFTLEFGVVMEGAELKAYGAGLLSSYAEIDVFARVELRPWDLRAMGTLDYDITHYQPVLFVASSFAQMADDLGAFFSSYDDEAHDRLVAA